MSSLLRATGRSEASDSKTVRVHAFDVPQGTRALALRFDYSPRRSLDTARNAALVEAALEKHNARRKAELDAAGLEAQRERIGAYNLYRALNNLMNVVLIDPSGVWRGRWDRNPGSDGGDLVLGKEACSPGFLPGEIRPGRWTAAVECHGVFGDAVSWELEVLSCEPPPPKAPAPAPETPAPSPKRRGPGWYFGELHSHTVHSDGKHPLPELAARAASVGIDFLCLTDHNTTSGLLEKEPLPVTLIPGCELTTFHGHHPIYGLLDIVPWHEGGRVRPLEELAPEIRRKGGVVSVAHPFKIGDPICTGCRMRDDLPPTSFDLIEVWYRAWDAAETDNLTAYALWNGYWAQGHRVTAVAARDWHGPGQEAPFPGEVPFTGVHAEDNTPEAILEGLRSGRVIMSGGPILDLTARARDGAQAPVGGSLTCEGAADLVVEARRLDGPVDLCAFRNGEKVATRAVAADGTTTFEGLASSPGYYRVEAWRGERPRVITNHVVVARR